jgi:large subunit ribosomal protein L17
LGRKKNARVALLRGLARSLVLEGAIVTTPEKAKELRPFVERLVTTSKQDSVTSRRLVAARLGNAMSAVQKLHTEIAPKYKERPGGYTRITKLGFVGGSKREAARIEFV